MDLATTIRLKNNENPLVDEFKFEWTIYTAIIKSHQKVIEVLNLAHDEKTNSLKNNSNWLLIEKVSYEKKTKDFTDLSHQVFIRASILSLLFKDLSNTKFLPTHDDNSIWEFDLSNDIDLANNNDFQEITYWIDELYWYRPMIWIFDELWNPVFLNQDYVVWIWAPNLLTLKREIEDWTYLEKYFKKDSAEAWKQVFLKLSKWQECEWIIMKSKNWRLISRNYRKINWFTVWIWEDVTNWKITKNKNNFEYDEKYSLNTNNIIDKYINEVEGILWKNSIDSIVNVKMLKILKDLSPILDTIWEKWQFLMNYTIHEYKENWDLQINKMWINSMYKQYWWKETYDWNYNEEQSYLIWGFFRLLEKEWIYIHDFKLKWVIINWLRMRIVCPELNLKASFWIWNDIKNKDYEELEKYNSEI